MNTELIKGGLTIQQVQAITRHKSERMTEWYNHFDASEFAKAKSVQMSLLEPVNAKQIKSVKSAKSTGAGRGNVIKFRKDDKLKKRKQA